MVVEATATLNAPAVPVDDWRPTLKTRANDLGMRALSYMGGTLAQVIGSRAGGSFGILMYHRIAPLVGGVPAPPYNVPPQRFREHLVGLLERGFRFVPLSEALACHQQTAQMPQRTAVLTFDDCFESVYTQAWPVLQQLRIPATLFLSTAYLDSDAPFPFDSWAAEFSSRVPADHYLPIRTEQCREMAASGLVELGTHTHTHADFREHAAEFAEEMQVATEIVKLRFGGARPPCSLPFGNPHTGFAKPELLQSARASRASCALTTECSLVDVEQDPFGWGRIAVFHWDTSHTLAGKLDGWYDWAPRAKHRLSRFFRQRSAS